MGKIKPKKLLETPKRLGAPKKPDGEIKRPDRLTHDIYKRAVQEAQAQGVPFATLNRQVWEWYFTALDTARADTDAVKMFDDLIEQNEKNKQ